MPCILLDNGTETQIFAIFVKIAKLSDQKRFWIKQSMLKPMIFFVIFEFRENEASLLKSVDSWEFVYSVT